MCDCDDKTTIIVMLGVISQKLGRIADLLQDLTKESCKTNSCQIGTNKCVKTMFTVEENDYGDKET